jgi:hypothetical protein
MYKHTTRRTLGEMVGGTREEKPDKRTKRGKKEEEKRRSLSLMLL